MAKRKVPSQAASGRETFNDNLVGNQITNGVSQFTATNFEVEKVLPERDNKNFKTRPFSEFLTLEDLKEEENAPTTSNKPEKNNGVRFRTSKQDAGKSLYGSLKQRLGNSVSRIISKFPTGFYVDSNTPTSISAHSAYDINYNQSTKLTTFRVEKSKIFNPMDVVLDRPNSNTPVEVVNKLRNFFESFDKYSVSINDKLYPVSTYVESGVNNYIVLTVKGNPFNGVTTTTDNFLVRPNDSIVEEFYLGLDDIESILLDRQSVPKYTAKFKVPKTSLDGSETGLTTVEITWPTYADNWNLRISGAPYNQYITRLSDIGEEIDNYKSNLLVRFLSSASIHEFDTEDQRGSAIFQLYGQSFDSVKKFIDNIAHMRNVSYDAINNIPDVLLKNLSSTLGMESVRLFDEKTLDESLYSRSDQQFGGLNLGYNQIDAESEFYRRLLINLSHIYKSKGTRKAIEFFLRFIGAPEPLIKINEHVYHYKSVNKSVSDIDSDIYDLIQGNKTFTVGNINVVYKTYTITKGGVDSTVTYVNTSGESVILPVLESGQTTHTIVAKENSVVIAPTTIDPLTGTNIATYVVGPRKFINPLVITTGSTEYTSESTYPIDLTDGSAKGIEDESQDIYFQKGAGWFEETLSHRSSTMFDEDNSDLTKTPKIIKTKNKPFTYGEDYYDLYRQFNGLDYGFDLSNKIDNVKSELLDGDESVVLNRKNIQIYLSSAQAIDYDVYRKSKDLKVDFGHATLIPQTGFTFAEYLQNVLNEQIRNSHVIRYKKNYIQLEDVYSGYLSNVSNPYDYATVSEFINKMSPYWVRVVEQFVPASTLWTGGNIIENNVLGRSKYQYIKPCDIFEYTENLFPEFETTIEEDLETVLGDPDAFRGLTVVSGVTYTLYIDIDNETFVGDTTVSLSGITSTSNSAALYTEYQVNSECTDLLNVFFTDEIGYKSTVKFTEFSGIDTISENYETSCSAIQFNKDAHLPLLCDFKCYLEPDLSTLQVLWENAVTDLLNGQVNQRYYKRTLYNDQLTNQAGWSEYENIDNSELQILFEDELTNKGETYDYEFAPIVSFEFYDSSEIGRAHV